MKKLTDYKKWLIDTFKGDTPLESIYNKVDSLLLETNANKFPINLTAIAKRIGINPTPLYRNQPFDGSLIIRDNEMRISLKRKSEKPPDVKSPDLPRMRFSYAHELIHCVAFDMSSSPPLRLSPEPSGEEEESICNAGASRLLLPPNLLLDRFIKESGNNADKIVKISSFALVSLHLVVLQLFKYDIIPMKPNSLYILSLNTKSQKNNSRSKPRCIAAVYKDENGKKYEYPPRYIGLECITLINKEEKIWSLLSFHNNPKKYNSMKVNKENLKLRLNKSDHKILCVSGTHKRLKRGSYIWSELIGE